MSTLPRPTGRELAKALERHGFEAVRTKGSHQYLRHADGRATVIPLRSRTLGLGLLKKILGDCKLSAAQLSELL